MQIRNIWIGDISILINYIKERNWKALIILLSDILNIDSKNIINLQPVKKGLTNESFTFNIKNKGKYVLRVPNETTSLLVNRKEEAEVYNRIQRLGISDDIVYIDDQTGIKISRFINDAHTLELNNTEDIELAFDKLKALHTSGIRVNHEFNLRERISYYEKLRPIDSKYPSYISTKSNILRLLDIIEQFPKEYVLCHIDANCDNFLITSNKEVYLIDFEYAGMQDPNLDIAMICLYSRLERSAIDSLIDCYYNYSVSDELRYIIYSYIAIGGFLWSIWCEVKEGSSVLTNQYALSQYQFAITYFEILQKEAINLSLFKDLRE